MIELLIGELKRTWVQTLRYPSEVIGGVVILTAVFYGIFVGAQYMAGSSGTFGDPARFCGGGLCDLDAGGLYRQ